METLKFNTNWNDKLFAKCFTTLRPHNEKKYFPGAKFQIVILHKNEYKPVSMGEVIKVFTLKLNDLNDWITYLDTGYNKSETLNIIQTIYKNKGLNLEEQQFDLILIRKYRDEY